MFNPKNDIIIVDDDKDELESLAKQFHNNGIGCKTFEYSSFFSAPLMNVRIAFFDIDLNPSGGSTEQHKFNTVASAITQYISKDNGPFALIFWTKNAQLIKDLISHIDLRHPTCPKPFIVNYIDKSDFMSNSKALEKKLAEVLEERVLKLLLEFEQSCTDAASKTINKIYSIIPSSDTWGSSKNFIENFDKVFSKIAAATLGFDEAKLNPKKAVYEALLPIFGSQLINSHKAPKWNLALASLSTAAKLANLKHPPGFNQAVLNTIFHIEMRFDGKDKRGAVIRMNNSKKRIFDSFNTTFEAWIRTVIPFKSDFKTSVQVAREADVNKLISGAQLIAIEISSACDFQQNKKRLNKYLFGVMSDVVPEELLDKNQPDSSMKLINFFWQNSEKVIWVNFNYVFGALPSDPRMGKKLFLFRKEIIDQLGNRYANHISRIGITSF